MFDEQQAAVGAVAGGVNPAASAAAALTLALNTAGVVAATSSHHQGAVISAPVSTAGIPTAAAIGTGPLALQQQQQQIAQLLSGKDSRWLQLEVCREYQRGQCTRSDQDCKYAHPPPHVEVQNGRVTACYDSIKGRCTRENPRCKYLHPPQHLKDQLLANGKQNLVMKNLISQQFGHQQQQQTAMPALAQLVQQPMAMHSPAGLPLPFFIPGLYGPAGPLGLDPFAAALQSTQNPIVAQQLALLQQQQQQPTAAAAALLLAQQQHQQAQQQAAQHQQQQQQQQLLYMAALMQQQQLAAALQAASLAQAKSPDATAGPPMPVPLADGQQGQGGRKRTARLAGLDHQQQTESSESSSSSAASDQQQQQLQLIAAAQAAAASFQLTEHHYLQAAVNGSANPYLPTKRAKNEAANNNGTTTAAGLTAAGMPLYAAPQFNPYLVPTAQFLPAVSFAGQLPPRF